MALSTSGTLTLGGTGYQTAGGILQVTGGVVSAPASIPAGTTIGTKLISFGYTTTITGAGTTHTITHNLNSKKLGVWLRDTTTEIGGMTGFECKNGVGTASADDITLYFDTALGTTELEVSIFALN